MYMYMYISMYIHIYINAIKHQETNRNIKMPFMAIDVRGQQGRSHLSSHPVWEATDGGHSLWWWGCIEPPMLRRCCHYFILYNWCSISLIRHSWLCVYFAMRLNDAEFNSTVVLGYNAELLSHIGSNSHGRHTRIKNVCFIYMFQTTTAHTLVTGMCPVSRYCTGSESQQMTTFTACVLF